MLRDICNATTHEPDTAADRSSKKSKSTNKPMIVLAVTLWSMIPLTGDFFVAATIVRQSWAMRFPSTAGLITRSQTVGDSIDLAYEFTVDQKPHVGTRYRYSDGASDDGYPSEVIQSYPVGKAVDVFYNPSNPQDCLLSPGVEGHELFLALFLAPFNAIMLLGWAFVIATVRPNQFDPWKEVGPELHLRTKAKSPGAVALVVLGGGGFFLTFIGLAMGGFHPPFWPIALIWMLLISVTVGTYFAVKQSNRDRQSDLILDSTENSVSLPANESDFKTRRLAIDKLKMIEIRRPKRKSSNLARLILILGGSTDESLRELVLEDSVDEVEPIAERIAQWFADRGMTVPIQQTWAKPA